MSGTTYELITAESGSAAFRDAYCAEANLSTWRAYSACTAFTVHGFTSLSMQIG
jgi:hypothetical protein